MKNFRRVISFIEHWLTARHSGGFGVHSPFMFDFVQQVLREKHPFYIFSSIEKVRKQLLRDQTIIAVEDFGTGYNRQRIISGIASNTLKPARQAQLLFRIIQHYRCRNVLELGTSLGITTMYMAGSDPEINCVTVEGCPSTAAIASKNFDKLKIRNIELMIREIDESLFEKLKEKTPFDFIFIDASHSYEATVANFIKCLNICTGNSIIVLDDIYWSAGMEKAWKQIQQHERVTSTVDLYCMGIVFLNPLLHRQHYKMRF